MKKTVFFSFIFFFLLFGGCTKITEIIMMKGEWQALEVKINGGELNQLAQLFPQFETNGRYLIYMMDDGVMMGGDGGCWFMMVDVGFISRIFILRHLESRIKVREYSFPDNFDSCQVLSCDLQLLSLIHI